MPTRKSYIHRKGFTLIELMIAVTIIGVLAVVAMPKFAGLLAKSKESAVKSGLGSIRGALSIYYGDVGEFPEDLEIGLTTDNKYLSALPSITIPLVSGNPGHENLQGVTTTLDESTNKAWFYLSTSGNTGLVFVNCAHNDSRGLIWSSF